MSDFNSLFGPLDKKYCLYFYILSLMGMILLLITIFTALYIGLSEKKDGVFYYQMVLVSMGYGIFYFQNRLLYNMCSKSLQ